MHGLRHIFFLGWKKQEEVNKNHLIFINIFSQKKKRRKVKSAYYEYDEMGLAVAHHVMVFRYSMILCVDGGAESGISFHIFFLFIFFFVATLFGTQNTLCQNKLFLSNFCT